MPRRAVFLDRDGTLVEPRQYPSRPEQLVLNAGVGPRLRVLQQAAYALVVITNQSGLARGYFNEVDLARMHDHLRAELARDGVTLDGVFHCPHHVDGVRPELSIACECRKPQPGMLLTAARELDVNLRRSWFIGDILDDVEAGNRAGCCTILVDVGTEAPPARNIRRPAFVAHDTPHALEIVAAVDGLGPAANLLYRPAAWRMTYEAEARALAGGDR